MTDDASQRLTIRPYRADDLDATVDLWYRTWHAAFPDLRHAEPIEEWRRRFETTIAVEERVYVVEVGDGRIAGFLSVADRGGGQGHLHEIFVAPEFQRQGIGSLLMAKAKGLAPAGLRLKTLQRNTQGRHLLCAPRICGGFGGYRPCGVAERRVLLDARSRKDLIGGRGSEVGVQGPGVVTVWFLRCRYGSCTIEEGGRA